MSPSEKSYAASVSSVSTLSSLKSLLRKDKSTKPEPSTEASKQNNKYEQKAVYREAMATHMAMR